MWRDYHNTEYAVADGALFFKVTNPQPAFAPPRGEGAGRRAYERIIEYCTARDMPVRLCSVSEHVLSDLLIMFPGSTVRTDRAWSDYLYLSDDLINLAGRRYAGQRNHINRFMREYPNWTFERINASNIADARAFIENIADNSDNGSATSIEANVKSLEVLSNIELYRQFVGVLCVGGRIVGLSIGETVGDTLFVHAEKADTDFHGSYPMLLNQFAKMFATDGAKHINREEDDGIEGLRTSKTSYHPIALLSKYMVELK